MSPRSVIVTTLKPNRSTSLRRHLAVVRPRDAEHPLGVLLGRDEDVHVGHERLLDGPGLLLRPEPGAVVEVVADGNAGRPGRLKRVADRLRRSVAQGRRDPRGVEVRRAGQDRRPVELVGRQPADRGPGAVVEDRARAGGRPGLEEVQAGSPGLVPRHEATSTPNSRALFRIIRPSGLSGRRETQRGGQPEPGHAGRDVELGAADGHLERRSPARGADGPARPT